MIAVRNVCCKKVSVTATILGHLSCIPFVCVTRKVQGVLTIQIKSVVEKLLPLIELASESLYIEHFW